MLSVHIKLKQQNTLNNFPKCSWTTMPHITITVLSIEQATWCSVHMRMQDISMRLNHAAEQVHTSTSCKTIQFYTSSVRSWQSLLNASVEERIGGWNVGIKQYTEVKYVAVKTNYFIIVSYVFRFCLVGVQVLAVYLANTPSQLSWEGILGKPKEEIWNLNGFEYMYLNNLKVPYFLYASSISLKVISMGTTHFPSIARLALP